MRSVARTLPLFAILLSQGCSERGPVVVAQSPPVAVVQPHDKQLDCSAILAEVQASARRLSELAGDVGRKGFQDGRGGGHFAGPSWFSTDVRETVDREAGALESRSQYLITLAEQKGCGARGAPK